MRDNMFKKMRRQEKQLSKDKAQEILKKGEYGILSTVGKDGYPYGVPMNYIFMNNKIYLHCAQEGKKLENIKYNNKVSFAVVGDYQLKPAEFTSAYISVIAFGQANFVKEEVKKEVLQEFILKFSPDFKDKGFQYIDKAVDKTEIIEIVIQDLKGKMNE
jgi:nitroimidazol reductase NimA-like FMN-containing flavoprotein (pyridoxamine 5'-phosphate oxidase superfamily)